MKAFKMRCTEVKPIRTSRLVRVLNHEENFFVLFYFTVTVPKITAIF